MDVSLVEHNSKTVSHLKEIKFSLKVSVTLVHLEVHVQNICPPYFTHIHLKFGYNLNMNIIKMLNPYPATIFLS